MLKATAKDYIGMCVVLANVKKLIVGDGKLVLDEESTELLKNLITNIKDRLNNLGIHNLDDYFNKCTRLLGEGDFNSSSAMIAQMQDLVTSNLSACWLMRVDSDTVQLYEQEKLFGDNVYNNFPEARRDIAEAGNCYALDRHTASVFHIMRAVEFAAKKIYKSTTVRKLMASSRVEYKERDTLGIIARNITSAVLNVHSDTKNLKKAALHLANVAEVERNQVMHTDVMYSGREAKLILDNAKEFMSALCSLV